MRVVSSFITNSSSASFIVGKKDDGKTKDSVFKEIKSFYNEFIEKKEKMQNYIKENYPNIIFEKGKNYESFKFIDTEFEDKMKITKELEDLFQISLWDCFEIDNEWLKCNTYREYENYWIQKLKLEKKVHAPFTIGSFYEDKIKFLHWGKGEEISLDKGRNSDLIEYYYEYITNIEECEGNCTECHLDIFDIYMDKKECRKQLEKLTNVINDENFCLNLLGEICVYSESGYIPDFVVKKLYEISEYCCNHMG